VTQLQPKKALEDKAGTPVDPARELLYQGWAAKLKELSDFAHANNIRFINFTEESDDKLTMRGNLSREFMVKTAKGVVEVAMMLAQETMIKNMEAAEAQLKAEDDAAKQPKKEEAKS